MTAVPEVVRLIIEPGDVILQPRRHAKRHNSFPPGGVAAIPSGSRVVLTDDCPGGRIRLRRRAARLGLQISREYVVLPSWRQAFFVVEDHPATLAWLWATLATVPPGVSRGSLLAEAAVRGGRHGLFLALAGNVAPGRIVIASRR
jgi:hypothetical protein